MSQSAFVYGSSSGSGQGAGSCRSDRHAPSIAIFANRSHLRAEMRDDAVAAGLKVNFCQNLDDLLKAPGQIYSDIIMADCPVADDEGLAAVARAGHDAKKNDSQLIVSTNLDALDRVFGRIGHSSHDILVNAMRADRVVAMGAACARLSRGVVREMSEEDRYAMLRLTEQVGKIAQRLERLMPQQASVDVVEESLFRFDELEDQREPHLEPVTKSRQQDASEGSLPDPKLIRQIIRHRQHRSRFFDAELFADPAWDILLDLTAAAVEKVQVSVTSLCIAAAVPPTTALRWIRQMTDAGLLRRVEDEADRRRAFIMLTDRASDAMASYFSSIGPLQPVI